MLVNCYCGRGIELPQKTKRQVPVGTDSFCCGNCLGQKIHDEKEYVALLESSYIFHSVMDQPTEYYSSSFGMFFRSRSEHVFALWCENKKIRWEYERYTIRFSDRLIYTPDFWLPDYGHFAEVKGLWAGSGKKKMKMARDLFHIVLVPDYLVKIMDKENNEHRRLSKESARRRRPDSELRSTQQFVRTTSTWTGLED